MWSNCTGKYSACIWTSKISRRSVIVLVPPDRQERDFLFGIVSRAKERKALDVVPVKVRERDTDLLLLVADGAKVSA